MLSEWRIVVIESVVASGEGDHSAVESKALTILRGAKSGDMCVDVSGTLPV